LRQVWLFSLNSGGGFKRAALGDYSMAAHGMRCLNFIQIKISWFEALFSQRKLPCHLLEISLALPNTQDQKRAENLELVVTSAHVF
jgi:hypothetical protein